jgi:hypothetical protein
MRVALGRGGGEVGAGRSRLGVRGVLGGGKGNTVEGGVTGHFGSNKSSTSSSLLSD